MKLIYITEISGYHKDVRMINWIKRVHIPDVIHDTDIVDYPLDVHQATREKICCAASNNQLEFFLDTGADSKAMLEFYREIYNTAIKDVAEAVGVPYDMLKDDVADYFTKKGWYETTY